MASAAGKGDSAPPPPGTGIMPLEDCISGIRAALKHPTVRFLREKMEKAGCPVWPALIRAASCPDAGGYSSGLGYDHGDNLFRPEVVAYWINGTLVYGKDHYYHLVIEYHFTRIGFAKSLVNRIKICCNHMRYQDMINQVLIHELIHAYDDCVAKNINWTNCAHHACSEIRANHLSGDCHYKRELLKGFLKIRGHEPECVKRRALASVKNNPFCSETAAKDAIEAVWDICYNDTRPFDRAP